MAVASHWRCKCGDECYEDQYDLDGDCDTDIVDIMAVASRWGCRCGDDCYYGTGALAISQVERRLLMVPAEVRVAPSSSMVASSETFAMTVEIEDAVDLGGFQLALTFDPAVIQADDVTLGDFLGGTGRSVSALGPEIDNAAGRATFGGFSFGDRAGASGDGTLATITLRAQGSSSTQLELDDVQLVDTRGQPLEVTAEGAAIVGGSFLQTYLPLVTVP